MLSRPVLLDDGEIRGADGGAPEVLGPTVEVLAELVASGPALELASGTGRVATRLREAGVPVTGIELPEPLDAQLRGRSVPITCSSIPPSTGRAARA